MEEADGIILDNLRKIGCDFEEDVTSLAQFTTELVIEGVVRCLRAIQPDVQLNHRIPPSIPARYKLCMDIAKVCKDIGYKGELGYETFLYGSQSEIRNILIFLIQKLPKVNEQPIPESQDPLQDTLKHIRSEILSQLHRPWLPYFCRAKSGRTLTFQTYENGKIGTSLSQLSSIPSDEWVPSLLEKHSFELAAEKYGRKFPYGRRNMTEIMDREPIDLILSRFALTKMLLHADDGAGRSKAKPQLPPKPTHLSSKTGEAQPTKEEQEQQLRAALEKLEQDVKQRQLVLSSMEGDVGQMRESIQRKESDLDAERKELERKEKLYSLLPEAPAHLARMEKLLESSQEKMAAMEQEWIEIKQPLEDEYDEWMKKHKNSVAEQLKDNLEQTIHSLRQIVEEIRTKEDLITALQNRLDALSTSALPRTFYTQRILSIVANVKKQNEEMHRVLEDVKSVQREINSSQGKVERTFTVTDEMIYKMAKTDETARRIYKYLISLHSDCNDILELVKQSGTLSREIKDLEEQNETQMRKNIGTKLQQVRVDLEQIRLENEALEQQIYNGAK